MQKINKFLIIFLFVFSIPSIKVNAASGLTITPSYQEYKLKQNQAIDSKVNLLNNNEFNLNIKISTGELKADGSVDISEDNGVGKWVSVNQTELSISSMSNLELNFRIKVPSSAKNGTYQPVIILKFINDNTEVGTTTSVEQLVPVQFKIFVSSDGSFNPNLEVSKFDLGRVLTIDSFQEIYYKVSNKSEYDSKPLIRLQIVDQKNKILFQVVENESLSELSGGKSLNNVVNASLGDETNLSFGKYKVQILVTDTTSGKSLSESKEFLFIPKLYIVIVLFLILIIVFLMAKVFGSKKKIKKKRTHHILYK